jgi:type IV fimbrial biogenesis protein FimT
MGSSTAKDHSVTPAHVLSLSKDAGASRGTSLIETIFVLATAAILLGAGLPMLRDLVAGSRVMAGTNLLVADLAFARTESIKRSISVVLCESLDGVSCTERPNWSNGWLIYVDEDDDRDFDSGEIVLRVQTLDPSRQFVTFSGSGYLGYRYLAYESDGAARSGSFYVCDREHGKQVRRVVVMYTGRVRVSDEVSGVVLANCTAS